METINMTTKQQVRALRQQGLSYNEIQQKLNVSKSNISSWCKDIQLTSTHIDRLKQKINASHIKGSQAISKKWKEEREKYRFMGRNQASLHDPTHIKGCMLYWAEGEKSKTKLHFCNSDPEMILLFLNFLKNSLKVDLSKVKYKIYCYDDVYELNKIHSYWEKLLSAGPDQFRDSVLSRYPQGSSKKRIGKLPYGTCHLFLNDYRVIQHIYSALEIYGNVFFHPST